MKKLLLYIGLLLVFSCSKSDSNSNQTVPPLKKKYENKLDSILGDKIINISTGKIRPNNFYRLKEINVKSLLEKSYLYNVHPITKNFYLLKQNKSYSEARHFNIILKTNNKNVTDYYILNDLSVKDILPSENHFIILCDDFENNNSHWKSKQELQILKIDKNFKEIWQYKRNDYFPFEAENSRIGKNSSFHRINVITGCHICYMIVELELSNEGKFKSLSKIGTHNSEDIDLEILKKRFVDKE